MSFNFSIAYSLISLGIIFFIWFKLVARYRRDKFRSNVRKIRDDLFDFMWKNKLDFNTAAYQETRQFLNGLLRCANVLTPTSLIAHSIGAYRYGALDEETDFTKAMKAIPDGAMKDALARAQSQATIEMLSVVFFQGLFGLLVKSVYYGTTFFLRAKAALHVGANRMSEVVYQLGSPSRTESEMSHSCQR